MHAHLALTENPAYIDMLRTVANVTEDIVASPVTEQELERLASPDASVYNYTGSSDDLVKARRQVEDRQWFSTDARPKAEQLLVGLTATFDLFPSGREGSGSYLDYQCEVEEIGEVLQEKGFPDAVRLSPHGLILTQPGGDHGPTFSFANFEGALSYARAFQIISKRLTSEEAQYGVTLALATDRQHELLVRAQDSGVKYPKRAGLRTFDEGYETILFAGAHLELGGAEDMRDRERFAKAVLGYTACAPRSGIMGPFSRFGRYFHEFTDKDGIIKEGYKQVFEATHQRDLPHPPKGKPEHWQSEDDSHLPLAYIPRPPEEKLDKHSLYSPYAREGCPATFQRIVFNAARLFMDKVAEVSAAETSLPPVVPIELSEFLNKPKRS